MDQINEYKEMIIDFEITDPYAQFDFIETFDIGINNLICFKFSKNETKLAMPGYLNPIVINGKETGYFDFKSPYGYSGPFYSKNIDVSDLEIFWKAVDQWYTENNVVTEFIRFNLFGNESSYSGKIVPTMLNIRGEILEEEVQWKSFDQKVRKNVNRAKRELLTSKVFYQDIEDDIISEFHDIYIQTMIRTNANQNFFYSFEQFKSFVNNNREYAAICTIYFEEKAISSELLLVSDDAIYSFLGGTNDLYFDKRPNDFLKVEALNWARNNDKKYYVLGGGYGFEDGIFKYKKSFFPNDVVPFYTGRKILNQTIYNDLLNQTSQYRKNIGLEEIDSTDESFFPLYNKQN
ncbi:GNAT family N-acetyltransferase [Chryseobacterium formosense]|uniref:GNAT family N-acetyltransferase n=1 Tax=Chryseobacterium formosense TaxID=236814 RepID=UPI0013F4545A|nr:GNAT family N-acetyltransferase [Chryseobacterium formosense]